MNRQDAKNAKIIASAAFLDLHLGALCVLAVDLEVDDDAVMKGSGIEKERGIEIE